MVPGCIITRGRERNSAQTAKSCSHVEKGRGAPLVSPPSLLLHLPPTGVSPPYYYCFGALVRSCLPLFSLLFLLCFVLGGYIMLGSCIMLWSTLARGPTYCWGLS